MSQNATKSPVIRDQEEPRAGDITVPLWLVLVFGALFYGCQLYLGEYGGGFDQQVYAPFTSADAVTNANPRTAGDELFVMGQDVFNKTCAACHQPSGLGKDGVAPPLVGSEWVLAAAPDRIEHIVMNGLSGPITVKGKEYNLAMPPWKDVYDDKHLAAVLTYIRDPRAFGNKAPAVKPEQMAAVRKEVHPAPMSAPELMKMPGQ
jgi:mono/diheme cytochrome c family protein